MSGKPTPATIWAIRLIKENGLSAYAAAKKTGIALSTIYRSPAYRALKNLPKLEK